MNAVETVLAGLATHAHCCVLRVRPTPVRGGESARHSDLRASMSVHSHSRRILSPSSHSLLQGPSQTPSQRPSQPRHGLSEQFERILRPSAAVKDRWTGRELIDAVVLLQRRFRHLGLQPQDRVVLLGENSPDWLVADLAATALGIVVIPIYARSTDAQIAELLQRFEPKLVVCAQRQLLDRLHCMELEVPAESVEGTAMQRPTQRARPRVSASAAHEVSTIVPTSGTGGPPKGAMLSHGNLQQMLKVTTASLEQLRRSTASAPDRVLHYLPLCFAGSRLMAWTALARGSELTLATDLAAIPKALRLSRPHYFLNVPMFLERIRRGVEERFGRIALLRWLRRLAVECSPRRGGSGGGSGGDSLSRRLARVLYRRLVAFMLRRGLGGSLRYLLCGSAPLSLETQQWFEGFGVPVLQIYGLTETTGIVSIDFPNDRKLGCVGRPIGLCRVRRSADGELLVQGASVFQGYFCDAPATQAAFVDGWFRTGDLAEIDDEGYLRVLGRSKEVIVLESGHNVSPQPLEEELTACLPGIDQVVVVGHGRPHLVALCFGSHLPPEAQRIVDRFNLQQPHYRRIRSFSGVGEALSVDNGTLTSNMKLRRQAIEEQYAPVVDALYAQAGGQAGATQMPPAQPASPQPAASQAAESDSG